MISWETIIHEHGPAVWRTAYRLVGNRSDADECMQEAFVSAVAVSRRSIVRNWPALLRRLVISRGIDCLRRRAADPVRLHGEASLASAMGREPLPDAAAQQAELCEELREALAKLPQRQAETICLRHLSELTYVEISAELQISVRHVGVTLSRAREKLRQLLTERGVDHG